MIITELEVAAARSAASAAEAELAEAERKAMGRAELDDATVEAVTRLSLNARNLRARAAALAADQAAEQRELAERRERERAAAKVLKKLRDEFDRRRTALTQRVAEARAALLAEFEEAEAFNTFVAAARTDLEQIGLRVDDVDRDVNHANGTLDRTERTGARLAGHHLVPLDPAAVVLDSAGAVLAAGLSNPHHLAVQHVRGRRYVAEAAGQLAALCPDLPSLPTRKSAPRPAVPAIHRDTPARPQEAPFLVREASKGPQPDPGWQDEFRRQFPGLPLPPDAA